MMGYRRFDHDGDDMRETKVERRAFDKKMVRGLLDHWGSEESGTQEKNAVTTHGELVDLTGESPGDAEIAGPPSKLRKRTTDPPPFSHHTPHLALPIRSYTVPHLTLDFDDPFSRSTSLLPVPKPSAAMSKLLEDHAKFEKREEKNKMRGSRSNVFKGLTVGIVMSQKAFNSLRDKWNLVSSFFRLALLFQSRLTTPVFYPLYLCHSYTQVLLHGGHPVIRYSSNVTHIVADPDIDEPAFLKFLGIGSRKEIKQDIQGVSYEWVSSSIRVSLSSIAIHGSAGSRTDM